MQASCILRPASSAFTAEAHITLDTCRRNPTSQLKFQYKRVIKHRNSHYQVLLAGNTTCHCFIWGRFTVWPAFWMKLWLGIKYRSASEPKKRKNWWTFGLQLRSLNPCSSSSPLHIIPSPPSATVAVTRSGATNPFVFGLLGRFPVSLMVPPKVRFLVRSSQASRFQRR